MKRDAYKFVERWETWKQNNFKSMKGIRRQDHALLIKFLKDMELGLNTPVGLNGKRSSGTLLNLSSHNLFFLRNFKKPLINLTKKDLHELQDKIDNGIIKKRNNQPFKQFGNYIKDFKVFWHWLQRTKKVKNDITIDISAKTSKPDWVYLDEEQIKKFFNKLNFDMRVICWFMYDSGARVTESNSLKVENFSNEFTQVDIPDEVSKTFGRTINLKICSQYLKEYVAEHKLQPSDYLFRKGLFGMNKYLKYWCGKIFGKDKVSSPKAKGLYGHFTLYDIRHNSSCYWLNRYPTHKGIMYRFGWKNADKIEYYSAFLGVQDELTDNDMVIGEDKNKIYKLEDSIKKLEKKNEEFGQTQDVLHNEFSLVLEMMAKGRKVTGIMKEQEKKIRARIREKGLAVALK